MAKGDFQPMLAAREFPDLDKLQYPLLASAKYNGIRILMRGGKPVTRKLLDVPNKSIRARMSEFGKDLEGLDGEIIVGDPCAADVLNITSSAVMSHEGEPEFTYFVFDWHNKGEVPFHERVKLLHGLTVPVFGPPWDFETRAGFKIENVQQHLIQNKAELLQLEELYVPQGYEGLVLRSLERPYKFGRSTAKEGGMQKMKRFEDDEGEILAVVEMMHNSNEAKKDEIGNTKRSTAQDGMVPMDTLGAFTLRDKTGAVFNVGTGPGLTMKERARLWAIRDTLPGQIGKFSHFPVGRKDAPLLPKWLGIRHPSDI